MKNTFFKVISLLLLIITIAICLYNFVYLKFFIEILKINNSLPTVSSNFYNNPINDITYKDIIYKKRDNLNLKLDIYKSTDNSTPSPVIIYVFGNGWVSGDKVIPEGIAPIIDLLKNEGYTIISTSYELMDDNIIFDNQISDIKDTIRWVYKNKDTYNFDTDNIGIISPSAGAQLSMVAAYSDNNKFIGDLNLSSYPSNVKFIIDLFGPAILSQINLNEGPKEITSKLTEVQIQSLSNEYSPIYYLSKNTPDTLIIHSLKDDIVPYNTSVVFYKTALRFNNNFELYTLNNCNHYLENLSQDEALNLYMTILRYVISKTT